MNKMMNALILENFGDHEFKRVELPIPQPEAGQVLVRIHASGVNPIDYKIRIGEAPYAMPELPAVLGTDIVKLLYYSYRIRKKLEITHRLSRSTILYAYV